MLLYFCVISCYLCYQSFCFKNLIIIFTGNEHEHTQTSRGDMTPFLGNFLFWNRNLWKAICDSSPWIYIFFWPVVFKYITCEQQTYFRSSLLSPSEKCILFYFSGGEKRQPEIHLLFGVTSQNANISMSLVRVSNLSALFCCGINWIYVVGNLGQKVANRGTALSWSYPMFMLLHFC